MAAEKLAAEFNVYLTPLQEGASLVCRVRSPARITHVTIATHLSRARCRVDLYPDVCLAFTDLNIATPAHETGMVRNRGQPLRVRSQCPCLQGVRLWCLIDLTPRHTNRS